MLFSRYGFKWPSEESWLIIILITTSNCQLMVISIVIPALAKFGVSLTFTSAVSAISKVVLSVPKKPFYCVLFVSIHYLSY